MINTYEYYFNILHIYDIENAIVIDFRQNLNKTIIFIYI